MGAQAATLGVRHLNAREDLGQRHADHQTVIIAKGRTEPHARAHRGIDRFVDLVVEGRRTRRTNELSNHDAAGEFAGKDDGAERRAQAQAGGEIREGDPLPTRGERAIGVVRRRQAHQLRCPQVATRKGKTEVDRPDTPRVNAHHHAKAVSNRLRQLPRLAQHQAKAEQGRHVKAGDFRRIGRDAIAPLISFWGLFGGGLDHRTTRAFGRRSRKKGGREECLGEHGRNIALKRARR